jgi:tRNA threonylcarbamoyladenosine biosynthesis protein TsaB
LPTFALDTSTASPSLALVRGDDPIAELWLGPSPDGGRRVLEAVHGTLVSVGLSADAIDGIVVGVGPGGFTGLRIGIATALGLGQALAVPVTGAVSLEALALGIADAAPEAAAVVPVLDARRGELFAAAYRPEPDGGLTELITPIAIAPEALGEELDALGPDVWVAGDGLGAPGAALLRAGRHAPPPGSPVHRVQASALARRVAAGAGRPVRPVYARLPDAEVNRRAALLREGA